MEAPFEYPVVNCRQLFVGFMRIGLSSIGGAIPVRHYLVEVFGWLDHPGFLRIMGYSHPLPGPTAVNVAVLVGKFYRGPMGALAAVAGLLLGPMAVAILLAGCVHRYGEADWVRRLMPGIVFAGAGTFLGSGMDLFWKLGKVPWALSVGVLAFVGTAFLHIQLFKLLFFLTPLSILLAHLNQPRETA